MGVAKHGGGTHLQQPAEHEHGGGEALLCVPDGHRGRNPFFLSHVVAQAALHDLLLCIRMCLHLAVMRGVNPPDDGKEHEPCRGEHVVCKEEMGEVECLLWVLL